MAAKDNTRNPEGGAFHSSLSLLMFRGRDPALVLNVRRRSTREFFRAEECWPGGEGRCFCVLSFCAVGRSRLCIRFVFAVCFRSVCMGV